MRFLLFVMASCLSAGAGAETASDLPLTTGSQEARQLFLEGLELFDQQRMAAARVVFEKSIASDPDFAVARGYLALSMNYTGDVAGHWKAAESSIERATAVEKMLWESHRAWARQDYHAARDWMAQVIEKAPKSRQAHYELGWFHFQSRDYSAADEALSRALAIDPTFVPALVLLARSRIAARELEGAEEAIERALEIDAGSPLALGVRGDLLRSRGSVEEATAAYDAALTRDPDFVPARDGRARSLRIAADYEAAIAAYRELCDRAQKLPDGAYKELYLDWIKAEDVCFDYGMTYLLAGETDRAARVFEANADYTYETRLENSPIFYNALARFYLEQGQLDKAGAIYDRSVTVSGEAELSPFMRQLWEGRHLHGKARIRARQGRFDEARDIARRVKAMIDEGGEQAQRFLPSYHYLMGYILLEERAYDSAVEQLKKSPLGDPFNRWLLARAYDGGGNRGEARALAEELAAMAPGSYGHALVVAEAKRWLATQAQSRTTSSPEAVKRLPDDEAGELVRRAIGAAGGWSRWEAKKNVSYSKKTTYFAPDGSVERSLSERHQYVLHPPLKVRIEREADGQRVLLINNGERAWKLVGGLVAPGRAFRAASVSAGRDPVALSRAGP